MNQNKIIKIKGLINTADCRRLEMFNNNVFIPTELVNGEIRFNSDLLFDEDMCEDEKISFINSFGERLSYICELYLKALIIPNMHFDDTANESEEELDKIFNNRSNKGIAKKYSHYFSKLLTSESTDLDENLKKRILFELGNSIIGDKNLKQLKDKYMNDLLNSWINGDTADLDRKAIGSKQNIIENATNRVNDNSSAYPESRYAALTDYKADLDFLLNFCEVLRTYIQGVIPGCISVESTGRHIFADPNSIVRETKIDGSTVEYEVDENGKVSRIHYDDLEDILPPNLSYKNNPIESIEYMEDGASKCLKYDSIRKMFVKYNNTKINNKKL